ncbi:MAG: hypothetical protein MUF68_06595 [Cyclobacteriaceae bacterium]|jgi:hypothetical protein|nr:hypothetical protein [Cyclobacteriaceae bacterium]
MKRSVFFFLAIFSFVVAFAQPKAVRKLQAPVNQPSFNQYAPFISLDGSLLLFLNDYSDDGQLVLNYTRRTGADWSNPMPLPRVLYNATHHQKGYTLSADAQTLYVTRNHSNGVGGFDICAVTIKGNTFGEAQNLGAPINSKLHDAAPTFSADGQYMYFMRCESMSVQKADKCKIVVSKKAANGRWQEPVELPANINTGNAQTPRIMADGETLLFASNTMATNKGGMDLYVTRLIDGVWTEPVALDFINTAEDDQYVSVTAQSLYLLRDVKTDKKYELTEYLFPKEVKPKAVLRVDGKLTTTEIAAYVSAVNLSTGKTVYSGRPLADGSFTVFLLEGNVYEVAIDPESNGYTFSSRFFDLTKPFTKYFERYSVSLEQVQPGDEIILAPVTFLDNSAVLAQTANNELRRLSRLLKSNPQVKAEIEVVLEGYEEDSVQRKPDLTEMAIDTVEYYYEDIDTAGQLYQRDTLIAEYRYHNDRTAKQAKAIVDKLISFGCNANGLTMKFSARPEAIPERRRLLVKANLR